MLAPNKLLESREVNPELLTSGCIMNWLLKNPKWLFQWKWDKVSLVCHAESCAWELLLGSTDWLGSIFNRTGCWNESVMENDVLSEKVLVLNLRLACTACLGNFQEFNMPNRYINRIHLQYLVSSFFNSNLTYLLRKEKQDVLLHQKELGLAGS